MTLDLTLTGSSQWRGRKAENRCKRCAGVKLCSAMQKKLEEGIPIQLDMQESSFQKLGDFLLVFGFEDRRGERALLQKNIELSLVEKLAVQSPHLSAYGPSVLP